MSELRRRWAVPAVVAVAAAAVASGTAQAALYWASYGGGGLIGRAKLNGTGINRKFITGASSPAGIALDGRTVAR